MKPIVCFLTLCVTLLSAAPSQSQTAKPRPKTTAAKPAAAAHSSLLNPASLAAKAPAEFKVNFTTSVGEFTVQVHRAWAPLGADRFYNLVRGGFFTNASFFRVVPGFVVQFGLSADPAVNKVWEEAKIQDDPVKQSNKRGTLVFASAGPNTRTTQLFINFSDNASLDRMGFSPFGEIVEGINAIDKIYAGYGEQPRQDLITQQGDAYLSRAFPRIDRIKSARILPAAPATAGSKPVAH